MIIRNSFYNLIAQLIIKMVSFAFMIFVVRQLGSIGFGKYTIATAFVGVLMVLCDLGLGSYVSREVARDSNQVKELLGNMIALRLLLSVLFIILATISALLVGYPGDVVLAVFLGSCSQLLFAVQSSLDAVLIGSQRLGASAFANLINQIVLTVSGVIILLCGFGFLGLSVASLIGILAATILNSTTIKQRLGSIPIKINPSQWPHLLKSGLPFGINQFALSVTYRLDSIMLGWFWSTPIVGMYGAAYNLIFTLATISNSVNLALFPHMSQQYARDPEAAHRNFGRYLHFLLMFSLPMATIGSVLAEPIAQLLFSKSYTQSGVALSILVWALPLMFLNELLGYIGAVLGLERRVARLRVVNAISNMGMNAIAIPSFGIIAASITTVLTEAIGIIQFLYIYRNIKVFPVSKGWFIRTSIAALFGATTALLLRSWPVLLTGAIALLIYFLSLFVTGAIKTVDLRALISAFAKKTQLKDLPQPRIEVTDENISSVSSSTA